MNKMYITMAAVMSIFLLGAGTVHAETVQEETVKQGNTIFFECPVNEEKAPGFIPDIGREQEGPDAFYISGDKVFIDDTVNERILIYEGQSYLKEIPLPWNMDTQHLFYDEEGCLKVIYRDRDDCDCTHLYLVSIDVASGNIAEDKRELSNKNKVVTDYCYDEAGNLFTNSVYFNDEGEVEEATKVRTRECERALVMAAFPFEYDMPDVYRAGGEEVNKVTESIVLAFVGEDTYHLCHYRRDVAGEQIVKDFVTKNDVMIAASQLSGNSYSRGSYQVDKDGNVYQMVQSMDGIQIYKLDFQPLTYETLCELSGMERVYEREEMALAEHEHPSTTKLEVKIRMDTYKNLTWTFNSTLNSNLSATADSSKVIQPRWLSQLADGKDHTVTNIPYCWGGFNAEDFTDKISKGYFAGNVYTSTENYVGGTAGMDCSGYVSASFGLSEKHGTATLDDCFTEKATNEAQAYDIINKRKSHVIIITNVYLQNGVKHINTYEQTADEGKITVKTGRRLQDVAQDGYVVMRYNNWSQ